MKLPFEYQQEIADQAALIRELASLLVSAETNLSIASECLPTSIGAHCEICAANIDRALSRVPEEYRG